MNKSRKGKKETTEKALQIILKVQDCQKEENSKNKEKRHTDILEVGKPILVANLRKQGRKERQWRTCIFALQCNKSFRKFIYQ